MNKKTALVLGATGLIGQHCLDGLIHTNAYEKIYVLVRSETGRLKDLEKTAGGLLTVFVGDFKHLDEQSDAFTVDEVFCCLGTTLRKAGSVANFRMVDFDFCLAAANIAIKNKVKHFLIVTAVNSRSNAVNYYTKIKGELESELSKLQDIHISIFKPSYLIGHREEFRFLESLGGLFIPLMNPLLPESLSAFKAIKGKHVALAMIEHASLLSSEAIHNSPRVSYLYYEDMQQLIEA